MKYLYFILIFLVILSACGEKPECAQDSDCTAAGKCYKAVCDEGKCAKDPILNCCGNKRCEKNNNENICSCPDDCVKKDSDACEGKVIINPDEDKPKTATYLEYQCNSKDECMITYDEADKREEVISYEKTSTYYTLAIKTSFPKPFDINKDKVRTEITLKDKHENLVPPIRFEKIQMMKGTKQFGENTLNQELSDIGDSIMFEVPISYVPEYLEDKERLTSKIDLRYTYIKVERTGEKSTKTQTIEKSISEPFYLINPGGTRD